MKFGMIGINYKRASLSVRERFTFSDSEKLRILQKISEETKHEISQVMPVVTCNRSEVYFLYETEEDFCKVKDIFCGYGDSKSQEYLIEQTGRDAISYLFRTAAGLESMVLGEDQILGQIQESLDFTKMTGFSGKELNKIVRDAITSAKKVKTQLKISENPISVSYIGIKMLEDEMGISGKTVLILGSGKTSELALKYVTYYGAEKIFVCNRSKSNAKRLKEEYPEIEVFAFEKRYELMAQSDLMIAATSAPHTIVLAEEYEKSGGTYDKKRMFLDLASPRDIDEKFSKKEQTSLIDLDELNLVANENLKQRELLVAQGRELLESDVDETKEWLFMSRMDATIGSLQKRCEEIAEDTYEYLDRKLDLNSHEQKILYKMLRASLNRLIREPIRELKKLDCVEDQDAYREFVQKLFKLEDEED